MASDPITITGVMLTLADGTVVDGAIDPIVVSPTQTPVEIKVDYFWLALKRSEARDAD